MTNKLHPDAGSTAQCTSAADTIETIARDLASATNRADTHRDIVTNGCWTGDAANAFIETLTTTTTAATQTVTAWQNLAATIRTYAEDLLALRDEANRCRTVLSGIDSNLADYRDQISKAEDDDEPLVAQALTTSMAMTEDARRSEIDKLDDIHERRLQLDNRTVLTLDDCPGPGAGAWIAFAYRGRNPLPLDELTDDIIDLIEADPYANRDLITQFLAMHGSDPETMDAFYTELGAQGLLDLLDGTVADMDPDPAQSRLKELISTSLAAAAAQWDAQKQHDYGANLIRAIEQDAEAVTTNTYLLSDILDTPAMPGDIGLGILDRVEHLRTTDPEMFADITGPARTAPENVRIGSSLMNTVMHLASTIPADALDYFTQHPDATTYWYGLHDWTWDDFEGPAALLNAITHDLTVLQAAATDPPGTAWADALSFFSDSMQALGGSLHYATETTSGQAKIDIALAASVFIPEIAALSQDNNNGGENAVRAAFRNGTLDARLTFDVEFGNLARAMGIAMTDPAGLSSYMGAAQAYTQDVFERLTAEDHPSYEDAAAMIDSVSYLYGHAYGSYSVEAALDAERISDAQQQALDTAFFIGGFIPGVSAGHGALDYLIQLGQNVAPDATAALTPEIMSDDQISAIKHTSETTGRDNLDKYLKTPFLDALNSLQNPYIDENNVTQGASSFEDNFTEQYNRAIAEYGNDDTTGTTRVTVVTEASLDPTTDNNKETRTRDEMP